MRRRYLILLFLLAGLSALSGQAGSFVGTNSPGRGTNFTFTLPAGVTNLSLVVSNNASAYSWLFLQSNGVPVTNSYEFTSRLVGSSNQINLEPPEFATGEYGLLVFTPSNSATQAFNVILTTNRPDLRTANYPVSKPLVFSTTGSLTNSGAGAWQYFQVDVPSNLLTGWRVVLSSTNATPPGLYINQGQLPTTGSYVMASTGQSVDTITFTSAQAVAGTYFIGVYLPSGAASSANYVLGAELASVTTLNWDPGTTQAGTQVYSNQSTTGGSYFFEITTETTANGVWRNALNVQSGQAGLYLLQGSLPSTGSYNYASTRTGSNGFVLAQGQQFSPGQNWYLLVQATPNAQWNLVTGQAYVQQLPPLAASGSGTNGIMGAEGMAFFQTTITSNTLAWQLGLNGLTNQVLVKSTLAPVPYNTSTYDLIQDGQMLVVPSYLNIGSQYFVGVVGAPGLNFTLDSCQQPVTTIPFNYTNSFTVNNYGYQTFLVQVPVQQIAWQINVTPTSGEAYVAVNLDSVPNEFVNLAFSEAPDDLGDSITLVPSTLTDGSFYVTVYGTPPYTCTLFNGNPVITTVDYLFSITNDAPNRVGWRFYQVLNTNSQQVDSLGWELDLANAPAGTEIAIRRNAVPGEWNYRNNPYDSYAYNSLGYADLSSTLGYLQQPNHPADVWYVGVYSPTNALGSFVLTGSDLTGPPVGFDGAGSVANVTNQPPYKWDYFIYTVPNSTLGWDLRVTNVTGGSPQIYVCLDQLPSTSPAGSVNSYDSTWPSGYQWNVSGDWTGYEYDPDGQYEQYWVLALGMGNPLVAGTYYVGVYNNSATPASYSLASRGIGTGFSIPVTPLAFSNGIVTNLAGLSPRQAAYYSVVVPSNMPSWRVELDTNIGDVALVINEPALPNSNPFNYPPYDTYGGLEMDKVGDQQYLMMPVSGQTNIVAGTYYLAVVSQGVNPSGNTIGSNSSSYTVGSYGSLSLTNMGTVDPTGLTDLLETNGLSKAGQLSAYTFSVPPNTLSLEVFLTNTTGSPYMTLLAGNQLPSAEASGYGVTGGQGYSWNNASVINVPNPAVTNYTLLVQAVDTGGDASYTVRVHAIGPQPVAFDGAGSSWTITNQVAGVWQYFTITVPANALGWDLRLTNVITTNSQWPQMYVCRGVAPSPSPAGTVNSYNNTWPNGYQWNVNGDWTGYEYDPDGQYEGYWVLALGMGNPLQAGTYYVGVINNNTGTNLISYTLESRGIGTGFSIPVTPLAFSNGIVTNLAGLSARQAAYYSVVVPSNTPSWRVELDTNIGDVALVINEPALPNSNPFNYPPYDTYGGLEMNKVGDQQYLMMPISGQTNIVAGTYYLAVVSQGVNPSGNTIGSNSSSYTLGSYGPLILTNLGTVDPTGLTDLLTTNALSKAGQLSAYTFSVPSNTLSLEVFLTNATGSPYMTMLTGNQLPSVEASGYGVTGGQGYSWNNASLLNVPNPAVTNYTLLVQAAYTGGDAGYTVRVHAIGPQPVAFDGAGSSWTITNQVAGVWQYFVITVPSNALGWDLRLTNVTTTNSQWPQMYVCRGVVPSLNPAGTVNSYNNSWPNGYQWNVNGDWTGYEYDPDGQYEGYWVLALSMGNPLQAGTYYVGVINNNTGTNLVSYSLSSRGIGTGFSIPVTPLAFSNGIVTNIVGLNPRQANYYSVVVPTNTPSWKVRLTDVSGETALVINDTALPNSNPFNYPPWDVYGGRELSQSGNEQYLMLPINAQSGSNVVVAGTYYLAVIGQGVNPSGNTIGTNSSLYTLESFGVQGITNLGTVTPTDILQTNTLYGGENALYQFTIPPGLPAVEVRLDNITASPYMTLQTGANIVAPQGSYGYNGGVGAGWASPTLITLPNPTATNYSLTVQADYNNTAGAYLNADFTVHIRQMPTPALAFDPSLNSGSLSNTASGSLLDGESAFYEVVVPATNANGSPVIGWTLTLSQTLGTPSVRVRPGLTPDNNYFDGTSQFSTGVAIIVPTYLTPGVWYVEVRASGTTDYTLTSATLQLNRPAWTMQPVGGLVTTPGLPASGPLFADTGVGTNGLAITNAGQGSYLAAGAFDYYEIIVPTTNTGVLRTRLDAISGNPNLYIRAGGAPTLSHAANGLSGTLYDRSLTASSGSEYGNWVPLNSGRYEATLTNGSWYLAVQAGGGSDVSYRLRMDTGSISNLSLNGGSYTNNPLTAGDWVYFSAYIPTNAPVDWNVTFAVQLGSVVMHVRDTLPPGQGTTTTDLRDWAADDKNEGPYPVFSTAGTYTLTSPPVRTGATYYLGFEATVDSVFSVSCTTNGGLINITNSIPFFGGSITNTVPGYGILKYEMSVPPTATRLLFNASNSTALTFSLEQGTPALAGGPAQWLSSSANLTLNEELTTPNNWPWLPGFSYYLTVTNTSATAQNFTLNMSQPADLAPLSFTAPSSVTALKPDPIVQAIWAVTNQGPATASGSWYDTVWFSTNGMLDANSINLGNFYENGPVPEGGIYRQTNNVTLPMAASGNYTLFVLVDAGDSIYEANLGDKLSAPVSGTFTLTPPDLLPISVVAPASVIATSSDPSIQVAWTATNQGVGAATGGWYDRVWFSTNGALDANSTDIGDFYFNQTVPVGGKYSQTNTVTLPVTLGGTYPYTLFVQVNIYDSLYESNYANNISAGVPGTLMLDLGPKIVTQPVSNTLAPPGANVTFTVAATGTPLLSYLWRFNNINQPAATNATLTLTNVQSTNGGAYVVVITNAFGAVTSTVANLLVAGPGLTCVSTPSGLIAWWPGQSNANDVVGGNNGALQNGATYEPGMVETAFSFAGANEAVLIPYSASNNLSALSAWTIEGWVNPASFNNSSYPTIYAQGHWDASLGLNSSSGALESWINNSSQLIGTTAVPLGQWSHVALVYNGTNRIFYLNGVFAGEGSAPAMTAETDTSSIGNIVPNDNASFNGGIDELSIYNRALSFDEIAEIYLAGAYGKCEAGPPVLGFSEAQPLTASGLHLMLQGSVGTNYVIQASTNLVNWTPITNFDLTNSPFYFTDPGATNYKQRFYRATTP
jgi:hypothetical protein